MQKKLPVAMFTLAILLVIAGCGFKLRGGYGLPAEIETLQLLSTPKSAQLHRVLSKRLQSINIEILDQTASEKLINEQVDAVVYIQSDKLERRLLSLFSTGQVAEYELVYTIKYRVQFPAQDSQEIEFDVTREYQDDPDAVLAKSRELDLIQSEMRNEVADRILRQIASSYNSWQQTKGG